MQNSLWKEKWRTCTRNFGYFIVLWRSTTILQTSPCPPPSLRNPGATAAYVNVKGNDRTQAPVAISRFHLEYIWAPATSEAMLSESYVPNASRSYNCHAFWIKLFSLICNWSQSDRKQEMSENGWMYHCTNRIITHFNRWLRKTDGNAMK